MVKDSEHPFETRSISEWAADERQRIARDWNVDRLAPDERAAQKRAVRTKVRERQNPLKKRYSEPEFEVPKRLWLHKFRPSAVLDGLLPRRKQMWVLPRRRGVEVDRLELRDFSFLTNPNETLNMMADIAGLESRSGVAQLDFVDDYCLDIAPYMVLSHFWKDMLPIFSRGGHMEVPIQKVLAAVGLGKALGMRFLGLSNFDGVWAFPMQQRHRADTSESSSRHLDIPKRERVADDLHEAINGWLGVEDIDRELTEEGASLVMRMIGELLDNAERHSQPETQDGDWQISAFMAQRTGPNGNQRFKCYLGFLSVGSTFAETMVRASDKTRARLADYVDGAKRSGARQSTQTLATVFALQDNVTSDDDAESHGRGGFGMMSVLEFVSDIGRSTDSRHVPNVTVVSGHSCIHMTGPYAIGHENARGHREVWFNEQNDRRLPPDEDFVLDLERTFPGTIVSVSFTIDPGLLREADAEQGD